MDNTLGLLLMAPAVALAITAFIVKRTDVFVASGFAWMLLGFWAYVIHVTVPDVYFLVFLFSIAMVVVMVLDGILTWDSERKKEIKEDKRNEAIDAKATAKEQRDLHPADKLRIKHGLPTSAMRQRRNTNFRSGW